MATGIHLHEMELKIWLDERSESLERKFELLETISPAKKYGWFVFPGRDRPKFCVKPGFANGKAGLSSSDDTV